MSAQKEIVIIGGGIIGCTTAYYLTRHPNYSPETTTITILEPSAHGPAHGASGKAGGLVAKWAYPAELVAVSFPEHARLAAAHDGAARWGFRLVNCGSWTGTGEDVNAGEGAAGGHKRKSLEKTTGLGAHARADTGLPGDLNWVRPELTHTYSPMAPAGATAQVHPRLFTESMHALAAERGARLVRGAASEVVASGGQVAGVRYTAPDGGAPRTLTATHVVLAAGAWSPRVVPLPIAATRAHSITLRATPGTAIAPYVLFTEIALPGGAASPEIYARPGDEVYACGPGDDAPLPATVDDVAVDDGACESIRAHVAGISHELRTATVEARQACYLPVVSSGGGPIIGEAPSIAQGLYIATGHTCWGICNAPGTAKALSELIFDGKIRCANLKKLTPSHFL